MGAMTAFAAGVCGVMLAIGVGLLKDEVAAYLPALTKTIIRYAARRLVEPELQARYLEEWSSHTSDYAGKLTQLYQAILLVFASYKLRPFSKYYLYAGAAMLVANGAVIPAAIYGMNFVGIPCGCTIVYNSLQDYAWLVGVATIGSITVLVGGRLLGLPRPKKKRVG